MKNKEGATIPGYDAVAYFTDNKAVKGNPKIQFERLTTALSITSYRRLTARPSRKRP